MRWQRMARYLAKQHALTSFVSFRHVYRDTNSALPADRSLTPLFSTSSLCLCFPLHIFIYSFMRSKASFFFLPIFLFLSPWGWLVNRILPLLKTKCKNIHTDPEEINKELLILLSLTLGEDGVLCLQRKCVGWGWILGCAHLPIPLRLLFQWRAWFIISRQWVRDKARERERTTANLCLCLFLFHNSTEGA